MKEQQDDKMNSKNYWFSAKKYGWGWDKPLTKEGWIFAISYIISVVALDVWFIRSTSSLEETGESILGSSELWIFIVGIIILTGIFISFGIQYGPKPRWRWGKLHDDDDPDTPIGF